MPVKRKASSLLDTASDIKRSRLNNKPSEFLCDLCTSNSIVDLFKMKGYDNGMLVECQCHLSCVEIIPETHVVATNSTAPKKLVISDHASYHKRFTEMTCAICDETHGAKIYCTRAKCAQAFHISCAQSMKEISLKVRKDDDILPYRLSCHLHGASSSVQRKLTQDTELRAKAMRNAKRGDTIVVRFPASGSAKCWVTDVNETTQEVNVSTTESLDAAAEQNIYTAKWDAIVVNDLLRRLASVSRLPSKDRPTFLTRTTTSPHPSILPTPPPDHAPQTPIKDKLIEGTWSLTSVIDHVAGSPESGADSEETLQDPPSSVPSETPDLDLSILSKTPGLVEAYATFMFQDTRWNKMLRDAIVPPK